MLNLKIRPYIVKKKNCKTINWDFHFTDYLKTKRISNRFVSMALLS